MIRTTKYLIRVQISGHVSASVSPYSDGERPVSLFGSIGPVLDSIYVTLNNVDVLVEGWHHRDERLDELVIHVSYLFRSSFQDGTTAARLLPIEP